MAFSNTKPRAVRSAPGSKIKGKVVPQTKPGMLPRGAIRTTVNLYTQDDRDEKQAAQGAFLDAVGIGSRLVQ